MVKQMYIDNKEFHKKYGRAVPAIEKLDDSIYRLVFDDLIMFVDLNDNDSMFYVPLTEAMDDLYTAKRFKEEPDMIDFQIFLDEIVAEIRKMEE